jgi:hypothetical protein
MHISIISLLRKALKTLKACNTKNKTIQEKEKMLKVFIIHKIYNLGNRK